MRDSIDAQWLVDRKETALACAYADAAVANRAAYEAVLAF